MQRYYVGNLIQCIFFADKKKIVDQKKVADGFCSVSSEPRWVSEPQSNIPSLGVAISPVPHLQLNHIFHFI
jgi:hypothetical protein